MMDDAGRIELRFELHQVECLRDKFSGLRKNICGLLFSLLKPQMPIIVVYMILIIMLKQIKICIFTTINIYISTTAVAP